MARRARVFLDFRMRCVVQDSIEQACDEHDVDAEVFLPKIMETAENAT